MTPKSIPFYVVHGKVGEVACSKAEIMNLYEVGMIELRQDLELFFQGGGGVRVGFGKDL